jgi:glycosyltransferase involved in cell wall biosynthesis
MRVLLGPSHELHGGIHGALTDRPAPGVDYVERSYTLFFQHPARASPPFSPIHEHSECEWVRFDDEEGIDLVHAARFPVETSLPWVVDADCLLLPLQTGAFFALGLHRGATPPSEAAIRRREALMLARYADPRCRRILLRTARARGHFLRQIAEQAEIDGATADALATKTEVVYPAVAAPPRLAGRSERPSILFMGRTFEDKGGPLALAAFLRLRERFGEAFDATIVACCPPDAARRFSAMGVDVLPTSDRSVYLERLARADIFFSPTLFESFGMGLVEAAAAGTAIVTSSGPGMEHIDELFDDGKNALFVSNALDDEARVRAYVDALTRLILDGEARQALAANAHALASEGRLALSRHNETMSRIYSDAAQSSVPAGEARGTLDHAREPRDSERVLGWSERTCHWTRRRLTPPGGLRICLR